MRLTKTGIGPETKLVALSRNRWFEDFSKPELIVYARLVAATGAQRSMAVRVVNSELYNKERQAIRALHKLEARRLIAITYGALNFDRVIEVL